MFLWHWHIVVGYVFEFLTVSCGFRGRDFGGLSVLAGFGLSKSGALIEDFLVFASGHLFFVEFVGWGIVFYPAIFFELDPWR